MTEMVAVYGTLRRGFRANYMMKEAGEFVGQGVTGNTYVMTDVGFPKIRPDEDGFPVLVDVYRVPVHHIERVLDSYEGVPHLYTRERDVVHRPDGTEVIANIYVARSLNGETVLPVTDARFGTVLDWARFTQESRKWG